MLWAWVSQGSCFGGLSSSRLFAALSFLAEVVEVFGIAAEV